MDILTEAMKLPLHEMQLLMADAAVLQWMADPENVRQLRILQTEYVQDKGWSKTKEKSLKREAIIPTDAYLHLPKEWRIDPKRKEMRRWLKERHPYLLLKNR